MQLQVRPDRDEFDRGVEEVRRLGFVPVYDEAVFGRRAYVAGAARGVIASPPLISCSGEGR